MPTQRFEGKRVEEHVGEGEKESGRERERTHVGEKEYMHAGEEESESALASPFICFLPPGPALCKLGLAGSAVCST